LFSIFNSSRGEDGENLVVEKNYQKI
jgi:hypothetical protein